MKRVKVFPIIQTITNNDTEFIVTYTRDDEEEFTIVDSDILKNYFINFIDWYLLKPDDDTRTDKEYFTAIWVNYLRARENNFDMLFKALYSDYDPIDNYDIHEDFTHRPDGKNDTIKTEFVNASGNDAPKTSRKVATYQSGEKNYEEIINSGKTTTTSTTTLKATYTDTTHKHGNAGVMTTSEVIRQEAAMRKTELASEIVMGGFVNDYLFYSGVII